MIVILQLLQVMLRPLRRGLLMRVCGSSLKEGWRADRNIEYHLHEYILALWGMPLGEMLDLERLSQRCKELGRYTFFFSSSVANVPRGVSSHVNGQAIL